ncbi:MAG: hypothetical protein KA310_03585 [Pseudomonadales bacterium]|nr:hypothetical protein [Pseudomonadales bacterium]
MTDDELLALNQMLGMVPTTIAENWAGFVHNCMPKDAPPVQVAEMRKSYFGGFIDALAVLGRVRAASLAPDADTAEWIQRIGREAEAAIDDGSLSAGPGGKA